MHGKLLYHSRIAVATLVERWLTTGIFTVYLALDNSVIVIISSHPKTAILTDIFVMLKILSSEYRLYACGKIFRMPCSQPKLLVFGRKLANYA